MPNDPGYTIPRDSYKRLGNVVRRVEHMPVNGYQPRPRKAPRFPPGGSAKYWQAVFPVRLRTIDPESSSTTFEPCVLAVNAGNVDGAPAPLSNRDLFLVKQRISSTGVFDNQGLLRRDALDELNTDSGFTDQAGGEVVAVGARYVEYIGAGDIFSGSSDQAVPGSGRQLMTVTIDKVLTSSSVIDIILGNDDGRFYLAHTVSNQPAIDGGVAFTTFEIGEYLIVHDSPDGAAMSESDTVQVFKERSLWLSDDIAYSPSAWLKHNERGWLPVMEAARTIPTVLGKATDAFFSGTVGTFTVQSSDATHGKGQEQDSQSTVFAYVRRGFVFRDRRYRLTPVCPGLNLDSTVTLEVVDPELRFRGTATADIDPGAADYVQVQRRNDATTYSTPNMDLLTVLNDLDFPVANGSHVEVVEDGIGSAGISFWKIVASDFEC